MVCHDVMFSVMVMEAKASLSSTLYSALSNCISGTSSSTMVSVTGLVPVMLVLTGFESCSQTVSSGSSSKSPVIGTVKVMLLTPGAKVSVSATAV